MLFDCDIDTMLAAVAGTPEEQARYIIEAFNYADPIDRHALIAGAHGAAETTRRRRGRNGVIEFNPVKNPTFLVKRKGSDDMDRKVIEKNVKKGAKIAEELKVWAENKKAAAGGDTLDSHEIGSDAEALKTIFKNISEEIEKEA